MKTLYLDSFSGIAGDMFLGLLLDLGLDQQQLENELKKLPVDGYQLESGREQRHGIEGCRLQVHCHEGHHHRTWSRIDQMLAESTLSLRVKQRARNFFRRLGEAEAAVHGIDIDRVHFHEVGAVDAIVDLVGAAIGLELLGIERLLCSPLPMSRGISQCAHGKLPLPAPATLRILEGVPVYDSGCDKELVTPTGATLVAELADFGPFPQRPLGKSGYGVGGWQLEDRPNLLRGILYDDSKPEQPHPQSDRIEILESNIDDSTPEQLGDLLERLFEAGALDVGYSPLQMKKNRPGNLLSVICQPHQSETLAQLILHNSSALGVRSQSATRYKLERCSASVQTELGPARVKLVYDGPRFLRLTAEYDDCRALARNSGQPLQQVYRLVESAAQQQFGLQADQQHEAAHDHSHQDHAERHQHDHSHDHDHDHDHSHSHEH